MKEMNELKVIAGPSVIDRGIFDIAKMASDAGVNVLRGDVYMSGELNIGNLSRLKKAGMKAGLPVMVELENANDMQNIMKYADLIRMRKDDYLAIESQVPDGKQVILYMNGSPLDEIKKDNVAICTDSFSFNDSWYIGRILEFKYSAENLLFADFSENLDENLCYSVITAGVDGIIMDYNANSNGLGKIIEKSKSMYNSRGIF